MAHITENLILERSTVALLATDAIPLEGAEPGYRTFASKCAVGDTVHYLIRAVDVVGRPTGALECGVGTILDAGSGARSIARTQVLDSSNGGAAVAFAAGLKYVSLASLAWNSDVVRFAMQSALGLDFVGMVGMFPISSLRPGWVKANGAAISRAAYPRLFAYYGTTYGGGDGSTTFNLPDYRGEFMRFFDDSRGLDSGRTLTAVQAAAVLSHAHTISDPGHAHGVYDPTHAHGVYDPTHLHGFSHGGINAVAGMAGNNEGPVLHTGQGALGQTSNYAATGIAIYGAGTGIQIYGAGTGITAQATGGAENRPRNVTLAAFIKY